MTANRLDLGQPWENVYLVYFSDNGHKTVAFAALHFDQQGVCHHVVRIPLSHTFSPESYKKASDGTAMELTDVRHKTFRSFVKNMLDQKLFSKTVTAKDIKLEHLNAMLDATKADLDAVVTSYPV